MPSIFPTTNRDRLIAAVGLAVLTAVAAALRWPGLAHGFTPDEVGMVQPWSVWGILWSPESASNPPLLRLVYNVLLADADVVPAGRVGSLAAGLLTVPLAFLLGRVVGRGHIPGFLAAAVIAFSPQAANLSTQFRVYATFDAVLCWHLLVVCAWAEGRRTAGIAAQVVFSAALLVQLHFMGAPILAGAAVALAFLDRRAPLMFLPAGLGLVPYALRFATERPQWSGHDVSALGEVETVLGGSRMAPTTVVILILAALLFPWLNRSQRVLLAATAGLLLGVVAVLSMRGVAEGGALWLLPMFAALFGSLYTAAPELERLTGRPGALRTVVAVVLCVLMARALWKEGARESRSDLWRDQGRSFSHEWASIIDPGEPVYFDPFYFSGNLHLYMTGEHIARADRPPECGDNDHCFEHEGTLFAARPLDPSTPAPGLWVSFECHAPPPPTPSCPDLARQPCLTLQRCP